MKDKLNNLLTLLLFFVGGLALLQAQTIEISGTVSDEDGIPIPGVNIMVEGTDQGTSTDFDGNYTLTAEQGEILNFSSIGFQDEQVTVGTDTTINVTLKTGTALDEVVVVGYGTQKKSDVTGAITSVKAEDLEKITSTSVMDALQGKVSGVSISNSSGAPGGSPEVNIRGIGTFGNNQPLYIVDGVESDPYFLNNSDIESMEILKDASSTAIYGTRAANGVVMITTKKGKKGKPRVSINSSYSINTLRKRMKLLDADGYVKVLGQMYENAGIPEPNFIKNPPNVNTDWLGATQRTGYLMKNDINVSGATDVVNYSISGNFAKEEGVLIVLL